MEGDSNVKQQLNSILKNELTAINQYFLHARMLKDWGFFRLAEKVYQESIGEMKHADKLVERILVLNGLPNLQDLGKLNIGENVSEIMDADLVSEETNQKALKSAIVICEEAKDFVSRDLFRSILDSEEEHVDVIETHLNLVDKVGKENWLQSQI